ncbi:MAG: UDP-N-acetylmuramate--L-alanine ligase, partial [Elusimicrobia bacterium]|nr:UDP-N-acetylmuramate--L-alanine ligase [Elusimicrobiota bacterium]
MDKYNLNFSLEVVKKAHFIGIGGIGMSGIAHLMRALNYDVSGSDMEKSIITQKLEEMKIKVFYEHHKSNIADCDLVILSSAIREYNPELLEAKRKKIKIVHRAEMLAKIAELKKTITISGTHGKTTVTSMLGSVFEGAKEDATIVVGGLFKNIASNVRIGTSEYFVTEADESDGSFLYFSPLITCVTNIDIDHMDHYGDINTLKKAFIDHISKVPFYGAAVLCSDDEGIKSIIKDINVSTITYGLNGNPTTLLLPKGQSKKTSSAFSATRGWSGNPDWQAKSIKMKGNKTEFMVYFKGKKMGMVKINTAGKHNVRNALGAIACGNYLGFDFGKIAAGLGKFMGVKRRMDSLGFTKGIRFIDDYGHHPTEIIATLKAVKEAYNPKRIIALFQPHRYSRTKELYKDFAGAFKLADILFLMDIYPAGEKPLKGVSSDLIFNAMTPPPLSSCHAEHGKFAKQISSAKMPNCDKPLAGAVSKRYAHQTAKPLAGAVSKRYAHQTAKPLAGAVSKRYAHQTA